MREASSRREKRSRAEEQVRVPASERSPRKASHSRPPIVDFVEKEKPVTSDALNGYLDSLFADSQRRGFLHKEGGHEPEAACVR